MTILSEKRCGFDKQRRRRRCSQPGKALLNAERICACVSRLFTSRWHSAPKTRVSAVFGSCVYVCVFSVLRVVCLVDDATLNFASTLKQSLFKQCFGLTLQKSGMRFSQHNQPHVTRLFPCCSDTLGLFLATRRWFEALRFCNRTFVASPRANSSNSCV